MTILRPAQIHLLALGLPALPANDSGGSSSPPAQQTITQNSISDDQRPYFQDIMSRAQAVSQTPYTPYDGPRVAGLTPMEQQGHQAIANMGNPASMMSAQQNTQSAAQRAGQITNFDANGIGSDYQAQGVNMFSAPGQANYDFSPNDFGSQAAQHYMNPYTDQVINSTVNDMDRRHAIDQVGMDSSAASQGAFGGSRAALMKAQSDHDYNNEVNKFMGDQRSQAYTNAQQQFNADKSAQMNAAGQRLQAGEFNVGTAMDYGKTGLGAQEYNEGQRQQEALMRMQGQTANEANRVAAAGVQLQGANLLGQMGAQQGQLGNTQQNMDLQRAMAQSQMGAQERGINQSAMDIAAQEFANQRDAERNNLSFMSGMMRGSTPSMINSATTTTGPAPNSTAQMLGLGIGALGAANAYGKVGS